MKAIFLVTMTAASQSAQWKKHSQTIFTLSQFHFYIGVRDGTGLGLSLKARAQRCAHATKESYFKIPGGRESL